MFRIKKSGTRPSSAMRVIVQVFRAAVQNFDRDLVGLFDAARGGLMGQNGASVALHKTKSTLR